MTEKNRAVLRCFEDESLIMRFLDLPQKLAVRFKKDKNETRLSAIRLEYALAIELLSVAPIRISNLVGIRLDKHLIKEGKGWHLVFDHKEVKNDVDLEFSLPPSTIGLLDLYL